MVATVGALDARLTQMLQPTVTMLGFDLLGVEMSAGMVRLYIDHEAGVTADDCAKVSRQVGAVLDVEDPIADNYTLEVSSPGVDRPLFSEADFERFVGHRVRLQLSAPRPLDGRRRFEGKLVGLSEGVVQIADADAEHELRVDEIGKARLVGEI